MLIILQRYVKSGNFAIQKYNRINVMFKIKNY